MNYELMADILEESKKYLWDGQQPQDKYASVCGSVIMVPAGTLARREAKMAVRAWIERSMPESCFVTQWLRNQGIEFPNHYPTIQAYRLRWIDQMIGILKS